MSSDSEVTISCQKCGALLPPTAQKCGICGTALPQEFGPTVAEKEAAEGTDVESDVPEPSPDEVPPYTRKLEIALGLIILSVGIIWNFIAFNPDRKAIIAEWVDEYVNALHNSESEYWRRTVKWPPDESVNIVFVLLPEDKSYGFNRDLIEKSAIKEGNNTRLGNEDLPSIADRLLNNPSTFDILREADPDAHWLQIEGVNNWAILTLEISYWSPELKGIPSFQFTRISWPISLYRVPLVILSVVVFLAWLTRFIVVERYRTQKSRAYEAFQSKRTEEIFKAKAQLEEARRLAESGQIAKALAIVNNILRSRPRYSEAQELKKLLLLTQEAGAGVLTVPPEGIYRKTSTGASTLLYLRILGTPYTYLAPSDAQAIFIGRQRRKPGTTQDVGNDVVIRVPGSDAKSLQISRRHLEIRSIDAEYFVIDKSKGNTKHNGKPLVEGKPVQLRTGDRLQIAKVITLEVLIRAKISGHKTNNILQVSPTAECQNEFLIEATLGDMLTEVADE